jgi:membrane-anchored glycerophosphoryl diester phosphodiesterase (GDPDase)
MYGAFVVALAYTQAFEGSVSIRRSFALLAAAFRALVVVCLIDVAIFLLVDVPVVWAIGTDAEFRLYAFADLHAGHARAIVDLAHTTAVLLTSLPFQFVAPLVVLSRVPVSAAIRKSWKATALSWPVYVTFLVVAVIIPHALGPMAGLVGIALYLVLAFFLMASAYFAFADAFGHQAARETP